MTENELDAELDALIADAEADPPPIDPETDARLWRRTRILCGFVPLPEMTQEETDWCFWLRSIPCSPMPDE